VVLLVLLSISVAVVGLAVFGAVSLFIQPNLPKLFFGAFLAPKSFQALVLLLPITGPHGVDPVLRWETFGRFSLRLRAN
jgi:hypothetical protein